MFDEINLTVFSCSGLSQLDTNLKLHVIWFAIFRTKEGDLAFKDDEVNRLTAEVEELQVAADYLSSKHCVMFFCSPFAILCSYELLTQEILADKENVVIQHETTISALNATVATNTTTIETLQSTLTQVNSIKAQLEAQVQNLQVKFISLSHTHAQSYINPTDFGKIHAFSSSTTQLDRAY